MKLDKVSFLFIMVGLGLGTLMSFQITWLTTAKQLIEEQFDQKVNLAMGSALTQFNAKHDTSLDVVQDCGEDTESLAYIPVKKGEISFKDQEELENCLSSYMSCYGIDEKYSVTIFDKSCEPNSGTYCCSINPSSDIKSDYEIGVSFEARDRYLFDKMKFMIVSSILIFFLLASICFLILWSLIKQKRITENNIEFFNNTAHELKTPLTNISLAMNLINRKHPTMQTSAYARIIKSESDKLASQIERVLFLSKMENGDYTMSEEMINIKEILEEVVQNMSLLVEEKGGSIKLNLPQKDIYIKGDYYHLSNVFKNLIDNAIKYCDTNPVIRIGLEEAAQKIKLTFSDNGIGISSIDQEMIFEKFQRVQSGNLHETKGFGIGLSYVKKVIELHKGWISVTSDISRGSKFQLVLPSHTL